ncbi:MAG: tRNA (guanosine(37)-N1)-methyltransferase TrmD [Pseudomonadota bacterium]
MWFGLVTLFPESFTEDHLIGVTGRALREELISVRCFNPRDFTSDRHRTVDDKPYGGGPGMLMKVAPLREAIHSAKDAADRSTEVVYLSPQGSPLTQDDLAGWAAKGSVVLVCGRYEGIDERVINADIDREVSLGDFVLSGGEVPALAVIDGVTRLLPGAVGDSNSVAQDSFSDGLLDFPQFTRPEQIAGKRVPDVLLSGNHQMIARWRQKQALGKTWEKRPDLIRDRTLTEIEQQLLDEYRSETES